MKAKLTCALIATLLVLTAFKERPGDEFKLKKVFTENFGYVPNGMLNLDNENLAISAFFMQKTEVTNAEYLEFLESVSGTDAAKKFKIQSSVHRVTRCPCQHTF